MHVTCNSDISQSTTYYRQDTTILCSNIYTLTNVKCLVEEHKNKWEWADQFVFLLGSKVF